MNTNDAIPSPELSIVVPCFNEEGNLRELYQQLLPVLDAEVESWEIVFADDGSKDATWELIQQLSIQDPRVGGLRLSRNFGHQYALYAGLQAATGMAVISMDADLQHPPAVIPILLEKWRSGIPIVNTIRLDPPDFGWFKRLTSRLYYSAFSFLSGVQIQKGMADFRLLDRSILEHLSGIQEQGLFLRGMVQWIGFPSVAVEFDCANRFAGETKFNFRRMLKFAWHGVTSFSIVPLRIGIITGLITSALSFVYLARAIYTKFAFGTVVPGWTSTVAILSFLFGVLFIFLGLLGEYIGRILIQVRPRPLYIVSEKVGADRYYNRESTSLRSGQNSNRSPI